MTFALRILSVTASAVILNLAAPPFNLWPLAWVGLIPAYFVIFKTSPIQSMGWMGLMGRKGFMGRSRVRREKEWGSCGAPLPANETRSGSEADDSGVEFCVQ